MSTLTDGERVIRRALTLMQTRGYGWSKAIAKAAETLEDPPPPKGRPKPAQRGQERPE